MQTLSPAYRCLFAASALSPSQLDAYTRFYVCRNKEWAENAKKHKTPFEKLNRLLFHIHGFESADQLITAVNEISPSIILSGLFTEILALEAGVYGKIHNTFPDPQCDRGCLANYVEWERNLRLVFEEMRSHPQQTIYQTFRLQ